MAAPRGTPRAFSMLALICMALLALLVVSGCSAGSDDELTAPEQAVQSLLELRAERSTDASAYAEFLKDPGLGVDLANASEAELSADSTITPTPEWETPYVSKEASSTARVVVVWIADDDHPDWPPATVFEVVLVDGRWVAGDALAVEPDGEIPPPLR